MSGKAVNFVSVGSNPTPRAFERLNEMVDIREAVTNLVNIWKTEGFNSVFFDDCHIEQMSTLTDFLSDGRSEAEYLEWTKNYVCFVAVPQDPFDFGDTGEYTSISFDEDKFIAHLKDEIRKVVGEDVVITYREGCHEFEVSRKIGV